MTVDLGDGDALCEQCGRKYGNIATHWALGNDCSHPNFSNHQREIITGVLMSDGSVSKSGRNPRVEVSMISNNYLEYVDSQFPVFGNGVSVNRTAEESSAHASKRNFSSSASEENYSDIYRWTSMRHPSLDEFDEWYERGKKVWPNNIELTPTVLKHWYCGDGSWQNSNSKNHIKISMGNELDNHNKINNYFKRVGLPTPSTYTVWERNVGGLGCSATFTVEHSRELWEYMGKPLPDFEYKWPKEYR